MADKKTSDVLYIAVDSADTPDGTVLVGQLAEAGAKIVKKYPLLFQPAPITYTA
jgi:hypothetical protein